MQVEVQLLKDAGTLLGVPVLPPMVGVDDNTWVIGVDPSTVGGRERERERLCQSLQHMHSSQPHTVLAVPVLTSITAGCRLMLGPLTAHTFTL